MSGTPDSTQQPAPTLVQIASPSSGAKMTAPRCEYRLRQSATRQDIRACQALRFAVFNLELHEGLEESFHTCLDADPFDEICDHLIVEELTTGEVVGTYRLQTGTVAAAQRGYYCSQEFDLAPFEPARHQIVELGRACVHRNHRNFLVLKLLWKAIAAYTKAAGGRYLLGCSSLTSQDPAAGAAVYRLLERDCLVGPAFRTKPLPAWQCPMDQAAPVTPKVPKLLMAYLGLGAKICGEPAIDREFKTIDFLTFLDLETLPPRAVERYLA